MKVRDLTVEQYVNRQVKKSKDVRKVKPLEKTNKKSEKKRS